VVDIAFNMGRGLQGNRLATHDTRDLAANDYVLAGNHTSDFALLTDYDLRTLHVAFDLSVDLQDTAADDLEPLSGDLEIIANDRLFAGCGSRCAEQSADRPTTVCRVRSKLFELGR
jgi:hypothetical protein